MKGTVVGWGAAMTFCALGLLAACQASLSVTRRPLRPGGSGTGSPPSAASGTPPPPPPPNVPLPHIPDPGPDPHIVMVPQGGHSQGVTSMAFSNDERYVLTCGSDDTANLWELETGLVVRHMTFPAQVGQCVLMNDGAHILVTLEHGTVEIIDLVSGAVTSTLVTPMRYSGGSEALPFARGTKVLVSKGGRAHLELSIFDLASGAETKVAPLGWSFTHALSPDGRLIAVGEDDHTVSLHDVQTAATVATFRGLTAMVTALAFSPDGRILYGGDSFGNRFAWDVTTRGTAGKCERPKRYDTPLDHVEGFAPSPDGKRLVVLQSGGDLFDEDPRTLSYTALAQPPDASTKEVVWSPSGRALLFADAYGNVQVVDPATLAVKRTLRGRRVRIDQVALTPDGTRAISGGLGAMTVRASQLEWMVAPFAVWDLSTLALARTFETQSVQGIVPLQGSRKVLAFTSTKDDWNHGTTALRLFDLATARAEAVIAKNLTEPFAASTDGRFAVGARIPRTNWKDLFLIDVAQRSEAKKWENTAEGSWGAMSPDDKQMLVTFAGGGAKLFDFASGSFVWEAQTAGSSISWSADGSRALLGADLWDMRAKTVLRHFVSGTRPVDDARVTTLSADGTRALIAGVRSERGVALYDTATAAALWSDPVRDVTAMALTPDAQYGVFAGADGTLRVVHFADGQAATFASDGEEWLVYTDDGYFDASRRGGGLAAAASADALHGYRIDQLAARKNRPDIILQRLGLGSVDLLLHFYARYQRRLQRLGIAEADIGSSFDHAPTARIEGAARSGDYADVTFTVACPGGDLLGYQVYVNDVPLFEGPKPASGAQQRITEHVLLMGGSNRIEVSATDKKGVESLRALGVVDGPARGDGDVWVLAFGVSKYKDARLDLDWAAKDARDVALAVSAGASATRRVHTHVFTDGDVTRDVFARAKALLAGAKVDDTLVLFVAGHGGHAKDAAADYYYLTADTDLRRVPETAASFESIEELLQGVTPRRKLFLLDACESGDRDDDVDPTILAGARARGFVSRGFVLDPGAVAGEPQHSRPFLGERERYIENDLERRSGAIVFSSSLGSEFSYERDDLQNGVFTHEVVRALQSNVADANGDGRVSTEELRRYVGTAVARDTDGLQHPVVDRDNLDLVFAFPVPPTK